MAPALKALVAQVVGFAVMAVSVASAVMPPDKPWALAIFWGGVAAAMSVAMRADNWWIPIHLCFAPALLFAIRFNVHPGWYLAAFVLLMLVYGSSFRTQVPLFLSNRDTMRLVADLLPAGQAIRVLDLGSGTGGLLRALARRRPESHFVGIESAPMPWLMSRIAARGLPNCEMRRGDFWAEPLARYDVVYAFLSPVPMPRLWRKARAEMRAGTLLISNSFEIPHAVPERIIHVGDHRGTRLYLYRVGPAGETPAN